MRNFRTAAVAAATAVTVAFGGAAVASADTPSTNEGTSSSSSAKNEDANKGTSSSAKDEDANKGASSSSSSLSQLGKKWGAWTEGEDGKPVVKPEHQVTGQDLFGKEKAKDNAKWAEIWRDGTFAALGTAVAGALIAAYNFAVYNNIVPAHVLDPIFRR